MQKPLTFPCPLDKIKTTKRYVPIKQKGEDYDFLFSI
jgi:hypothetical protein